MSKLDELVVIQVFVYCLFTYSLFYFGLNFWQGAIVVVLFLINDLLSFFIGEEDK